jgi:DNA processing protein
MYVQRDRVVAGLSKAVLVTEAALNSGSLITANYAKKFGRKIFAIPGQITSDVSRGTLKLIKEGAEPVSEAKDVLSFYKILHNPEKIERSPTSHEVRATSGFAQSGSLEEKIIQQLQHEPMKADDLSRLFCIPASQIGTTLSLMQIKGLINSDNGKYYIN